jgi:carbamoyltransferase
LPLNGYYLSAYVNSPGKFSFLPSRHDQCLSLFEVTDEHISLVRCWELERYTGFKHHNAPLYESETAFDKVVGYLLGTVGLHRGDIRATWGTPGFPGATELPPARHDFRGLPIHSICHIYTGLYLTDEFRRGQDILCLAMDGGPDYTLDKTPARGPKFAGALARGGELSFFPVESPGPLWSEADRVRKIEPGTLMALSSATDSALEFDNDLILRSAFYGDAMKNRSESPEYWAIGELIAQAERALSDGKLSGTAGFTERELLDSAIGKVIQACSEEIVRRNIDRAVAATGLDPHGSYLSVTGGYALNCPSNSAMLAEYGFRGLLTPPCPNDAGQALGIGLLALESLGAFDTRPFEHTLPFCGERAVIPPSGLAGAADPAGEEYDAEVFAADLRAGPTAWVCGQAEAGPRALGHRSLLASPESLALRDRLNEIKGRQWWRPVAPIVLEEAMGDWFAQARRSPFMLETFTVRPAVRDLVPAITHLDGSARVQTLNAADDPVLHRAVSAFARVTGVPIICNTSLNGKGEPIVNTLAEAVDFCQRKQIAALYVDGRRYQVEIPAAGQAAVRPLAALYAGQRWDPSILEADDLDFALLFLIWRHPALADHGSWTSTAARARRALRLAPAPERQAIEDGGRRFAAHARRHFAARGAFSSADAELS